MERIMKDSGIEWIGKIPDEWKIVKFKTQADIIMGQSPDGNDIKSEGQTLFMQGNREFGEKYPNPTLYCDTCNKHSRVGDILMSVRAPVGAINEADKVYGIGRGLCSIKAENIDNGFLKYYLKKSVDDLRYYSNGSTFEAITVEILENFRIAIPTENEQVKIAEFLDDKIGEVDTIISKTKASIEEYKKYKQSVITEAVTKGLDVNIPFKESGIKWIGKIPKEFICVKLRHCVQKIGDVDHYMPETVVDGIPYVMTGDLEEKVSEICFDGCKMISEDDYAELSKKITAQQGDVILARYATIGTVSYVDIDKRFIVSYSCVVIKPKKELNGKFLYYYSKSSAFEEELKKYTNSNTQGNVGIDSLYQAKIVLPSMDRQEEIVEYLDAKCGEIDALIAKKEAFVDEMETYKKSLIYEYVTGKKEVL